jgi:hypothetical protein
MEFVMMPKELGSILIAIVSIRKPVAKGKKAGLKEAKKQGDRETPQAAAGARSGLRGRARTHRAADGAVFVVI